MKNKKQAFKEFEEDTKSNSLTRHCMRTKNKAFIRWRTKNKAFKEFEEGTRSSDLTRQMVSKSLPTGRSSIISH